VSSAPPPMSRGEKGGQKYTHVIEGLSFSRPKELPVPGTGETIGILPVDQYSADIPEDISSIAWGFATCCNRFSTWLSVPGHDFKARG
jgi:hypothetical protein